MSNQEKILFLKRYVWLDREINRKMAEIEQWRSRLGKVTAVPSSQPGGGGSIYKSSDTTLINKIVDMEQEINREIDKVVDVRREIGLVINSVENSQEKLLLQYRYLDGRTFEWIAVEMHYHWQWIHRLHKRALSNLEIKACRSV